MLKVHKYLSKNLASLFWPEFVVVGDCIFIKSKNTHKGNRHLYNEAAAYPMETEAEINCRNILVECFQHDARAKKAPFYKTRHPDFLRACEMGRAICALWASKLMNDFPNADFRVYFHGFMPIVRFHKVRRRKANFFEAKHYPNEIENGEVVILDTRILKRQKTRKRIGGITMAHN